MSAFGPCHLMRHLFRLGLDLLALRQVQFRPAACPEACVHLGLLPAWFSGLAAAASVDPCSGL